MADAVALLQQLGFGEYEARAYVALLQRSPLNGYELAKASGLPRANVYAVLQKLEERGAVVRVETPAGVRYASVPPSELTRRLGNSFQETLEAAQRLLVVMTSPAEYEYVGNLRGYPLLLEHARSLLDATQERLLVAIWPQEASALAEPLAQAEQRGVEITTLCLEACPSECGGCRGRIYRYRVAPDYAARWLVLVPDGAEVLAGEIGPNQEALAVRTRQRLLVELASWYTRHSIALAAVLRDLGGRLDGLLGPETQAMLASVGPGGRGSGWLEHMRRLLGRGGGQTAV
ncbi:MAG: TrmB family transcriptional regulator [Chloroflexi bacterium]|nr:TrmB family transcriptional regulator [Chloroflexota bacterium]